MAIALSDAIGDLRGKTQGLTASVYGDSPMQYADTFRAAYKNLNQPNAPENIIIGGTKSLADNFIDRVYKKTGAFPSEDQIRDFVSQNLTTRYAEEFVTGTINDDSVKTRIVDPYLQINADQFKVAGAAQPSAVQPDVEKRALGLSDRLKQIYADQEKALTEKIDEDFRGQRSRAIEEEAALGRLRSPVSIGTVGKIDANRSNMLSQALATLRSGQAAGETDIAKTIEAILAGERRAGEEGDRFERGLALEQFKFGKQLSEGQRRTDIDRGLQERGFGLSEALGRMQADARKPGTLDYINTGLKAADTALKIGAAFAG